MIAGLVLAGGGSKRFGSPKFAAEIDGVSLGHIALTRLERLCSAVAVAGVPQVEAAGHTHIADAPVSHSGPLSGLLAGLEWAHGNGARWLLVTPCDVPLLHPETLDTLTSQTATANARVGMLSTKDQTHPLCSVWATELLARLRSTLNETYPSAQKLGRDLGAHIVLTNEPAQLANVNTPDDLTHVSKLNQLHWWKRPQSEQA